MAAGDLQRGAHEARLTPPTIYALATGAPPTAIAIVRVSGPASIDMLRAITGRPVPQPRRLTRRTLIGSAADRLDDALVAVFPAPASVTGDDVVELHLHGGPAVVAAVLATLDELGLTPAAPGAFTRRAFDNGKIDLGEAEGSRDLIAAETTAQRRAALARTSGALAAQLDRWRDVLMAARRDVEVLLDFSDDVADDAPDTSSAALHDLYDIMIDARRQLERSALLRDGLVVAISGPVNAGKSTLFNALAGREAALVSPLPGTTRDAVEVRLALGGVLVNLTDTAGTRTTSDPLEHQAIARGVERAASADIVIALGPSERRDAIKVAAKSDLGAMPAAWDGDVLHLSAATGAGLDLLRDELARRAVAHTAGEPPLIAGRHRARLLDTAVAALRVAVDAEDLVVRAEELRRASNALDALSARPPDDVLDTIFAQFCIGK